MPKMTPEAEARYALDYGLARRDLPIAAQLEYDRLCREGYGQARLGPAPAPPQRFPSSADTRRQILEAVAASNGKYAKPFDKGKMSALSLFGTESWSEYGQVVLQMAMLDTLLSIEQLLQRIAGEGGEDDQPSRHAG